MEEILELIHNEFIESEEYYVFLRRLEEEQEFVLKNTCQIEKFDYFCKRIKTFRKNNIFIKR